MVIEGRKAMSSTGEQERRRLSEAPSSPSSKENITMHARPDHLRVPEVAPLRLLEAMMTSPVKSPPHSSTSSPLASAPLLLSHHLLHMRGCLVGDSKHLQLASEPVEGADVWEGPQQSLQ